MVMDLLTRMEFGQSDLATAIAMLSPREVDLLEFGAIQLDGDGKVLAYNQTESNFTGQRKAAVIGRHFFSEIAPYCDTPAFRGTFDAGVKAGKLNAIFDYTFNHVTKPTRVKIQLKNALADNTYWVFVKRL